VNHFFYHATINQLVGKDGENDDGAGAVWWEKLGEGEAGRRGWKSRDRLCTLGNTLAKGIVNVQHTSTLQVVDGTNTLLLENRAGERKGASVSQRFFLRSSIVTIKLSAMPLWHCADFSLYIVYLASNEYSQAARANSFDRESLSLQPPGPFLAGVAHKERHIFTQMMMLSNRSASTHSSYCYDCILRSYFDCIPTQDALHFLSF